VVKGQVTRFQAAYVSQQEMQAVVAKLRIAAVSPKPRRWPAEDLAATGTDGKDGRAEPAKPANGKIVRSEWTDPQRMMGTVARQLRLIK
jgi:hypothetical protein